MFLEKHSRFFRRFEFLFTPRHSGAPYLPLFAKLNEYSIWDALNSAIDAEEAFEKQANGDVIEFVKIKYEPENKALVLLAHRASPDAADPAYRKKAKHEDVTKVTVRKSKKEDGEEQSVSAHIIIDEILAKEGVYRAALEEIPGISMASIRRLISKALNDYKYEFERKKKSIETYSTFKPTGVPSETLTGALKSGSLNYLTLTRPAKAEFVDADGLFSPQLETMRLRVKGEITSNNWKDLLPNFMKKAAEAGWTDFSVDLEFDDKRRRTVKLDRQDEAQEILFVRSDELNFQTELEVCSVNIVPEIVTKALKLIRAK